MFTTSTLRLGALIKCADVATVAARPQPEISRMSEDKTLTNHEVTICLAGGAMLGPFNATWGGDAVSDVRELSKDYDAFLQGEPQSRYKYHLHDAGNRFSHTLILNFANVTAIYDQVHLSGR